MKSRIISLLDLLMTFRKLGVYRIPGSGEVEYIRSFYKKFGKGVDIE